MVTSRHAANIPGVVQRVNPVLAVPVHRDSPDSKLGQLLAGFAEDRMRHFTHASENMRHTVTVQMHAEDAYSTPIWTLIPREPGQ